MRNALFNLRNLLIGLFCDSKDTKKNSSAQLPTRRYLVVERGVGDKNGNQPFQNRAQILTTVLLDGCDLDELEDELRGAEDCELIAESALLPELVEIC